MVTVWFFTTILTYLNALGIIEINLKKQFKKFMQKSEKQEISRSLKNARIFLVIGVLVILLMPFLLTLEVFHDRFNFSETGQIGDTIGGITSPFLNLIGAILVFYALRAQVKANELIQNQIDEERLAKEDETETTNLNQLYTYLLENVNEFRFKTLPIEDLRNTEFITTNIEYKGGEAFYNLFNQIRCHYHGSVHDLRNHQSISELTSLLNIINLLLEKLENSKCTNQEILQTLTKHIFEHKIITRIKDDNVESLKIYFCDDCDCNHGLPDEFIELIKNVQHKIEKAGI